MLFDNRADKRYWVESDGSLREFDPGLDRSGATAQSRAPWYRRHQWLLTALGAVLLGSLFLVAARWRRRRNLTATGHQGDQAPV